MSENSTPCNCPNVKCIRHGHCEECRKNHKSKTMYCALRGGSLRKRLTDMLFGRKSG